MGFCTFDSTYVSHGYGAYRKTLKTPSVSSLFSGAEPGRPNIGPAGTGPAKDSGKVPPPLNS